MQIPKLANEERRREFNDYTHEEHVKVIKAYLFDGMSHRKIDRMILNLDDSYTRGWQSMGILHYLGIRDPFKGLFKGMDVKDLRVLINTVPFSSDAKLTQVVGRLRRIPDKEVIFIDINDIGFDAIKNQLRLKKTKVYTVLGKKIFERLI